jgi:hypothetical protein
MRLAATFLCIIAVPSLAQGQPTQSQGDSPSRSNRTAAHAANGVEDSCEPYKSNYYFRDGDECKNAVGDYSTNGNDLGNSITSTYSAVGANGEMGFVDYEWDLPANPDPVRLRIRGAVKNTTSGSMKVKIWDGGDYVTVVEKQNSDFESYKYSKIGLYVKDKELIGGGYFAVQIVTDDGWWIDDIRADWTDSTPKIDLEEADVIEAGDRGVGSRRDENRATQQSSATCSVSFTGFLFRTLVAYAQHKESDLTPEDIASSVANATVGTVAAALRRCEKHFERVARDVERTRKEMNDKSVNTQVDTEKFIEWLKSKNRDLSSH